MKCSRTKSYWISGALMDVGFTGQQDQTGLTHFFFLNQEHKARGFSNFTCPGTYLGAS